MNETNESLSAARRVLKKKTVEKLVRDDRITPHGMKILERWARSETFTLQQLERKWDIFLDVLLNQQEWEHPSSAENIEWQLRNGLTSHELLEMGAPDLSCRHAIRRAEVSAE